jgi:hypothetical protein
MRRPALHCVLLSALLLPSLSLARPAGDLWGLDPGVLAATGGDLLQRAPDPQVDGLFQAVHAVARNDDESGALCALFQPGADRSIGALDTFASQLGPASRSRFADALSDLLLAAVQSPAQAFDRAAAKQSLKGAAVTAALLHDGFTAGLQAADDADGRSARCQSLRWLLDAMQSRPQADRAAMTRFLLDEGLARIATSAN